jgi:intein/homing endonuclease
VQVSRLHIGDKMVIRHTVKALLDEATTPLNTMDKPIPIQTFKLIARIFGYMFGHVSDTVSFGEECDAVQFVEDLEAIGFERVQVEASSTNWTVQLSQGVQEFITNIWDPEVDSHLPEWLIDAEPSVKREFLSGFQGRNGSVIMYENDKMIRLNSTFRATRPNELNRLVKMMVQISELFFDLNIHGCVNYVDTSNNAIHLMFDRHLDNIARYANTIGYTYCDKKRRDSALAIETVLCLSSGRIIPLEHLIEPLTHGCNTGCVSVPILSIREVPVEPVYDFTTYSDNHSFVASSFVSSNCAETPEGQSIGIVKNISYMAHITIPTNSASLYEYVTPHVLSVNDTPPEELNDKVKVFVNGCWLGVTEDPEKLYQEMKDKKYRGIINIYTSIIFDIKMMEIRICNDGGRLTRPLLRVRDNQALITKDIIERLTRHELTWNDLLTNCRLEESVVEYIDPDEQNLAMIAMKCKDTYLHCMTGQRYRFTHCEIHPSTIFGVVASCVPYPDHNQAPRNTYQCLHPDELVWMADGTKVPIKDVKIGDDVLTFHPETLEITETKVVNQFVRPNEFPIYRLTTVSGKEIRATEDHKFMTNMGWKTVKEMIEDPVLKMGMSMNDYSIIPQTICNAKTILTEEQFVQIMRDLEVEESKNRKISKIFKYVNQLKDIGLLPLKEDNPVLPILCRIIGFLYADGSMLFIDRCKKIGDREYKSKEFQCSFDFGRENDAIVFENDLQRCGFSKNKIMEGTRSFTHKDSNRVQTHHTFTCIHNGCFPAFLIALGIGYGKKTETPRTPIPDWVMDNKEYGRQFMKGFQGGDGCKITCYEGKTSITMHSTSQQINPVFQESLSNFMEQCVQILARCDVEAYMLPMKTINAERVIVAFQISQKNNNLVTYYNEVGYAYSETKNNQSYKIIEYLKARAVFCSRNNILNDQTLLHAKKFDRPTEWFNKNIEEKNNCIFVPVLSITPEPDGLISCVTVQSENKSILVSNDCIFAANCAMGKQAMGVYATNYDQRMDKTAYILNYPSRPLVETRIMNIIRLNQIPSGCQIHVAIMTHTGYNQEDSVLINKGSIDRGLFMATIYHTEKDEDKNIIRDEIIRCKPDPTKTKGIKFGNYDKLNSQGFIPENSLVENRDVIIAKTIPIKENRNDPTKTVKYEDQSKTFRTTEETYIDKNFTGRNGDGYNFAKVRVRTLRKPVLGDKFSSRHGKSIIAIC